MTEKVNKRHSLGKIFDRIFRGRSNSLPASTADGLRKPDKDGKRKKSKKENNKNVVDDEFGIEETERLKHFQKPKPPSQRRRPRGLPPAKNSVSPSSVVAPIMEEDENPSGEVVCHFPENGVSENKNNENVIVTVNDKVTQAPKLFTPSLPSVSLREKLLAKKDRQTESEETPTNVIPEVDEDDKSLSIEIIDENESELRKKKESESSINSDGVTSTKSSIKSLSRSLSAKVDVDLIRSKSKNLRLVKSLEVGQTSVSEHGKSMVRSSDPGRQ